MQVIAMESKSKAIKRNKAFVLFEISPASLFKNNKQYEFFGEIFFLIKKLPFFKIAAFPSSFLLLVCFHQPTALCPFFRFYFPITTKYVNMEGPDSQNSFVNEADNDSMGLVNPVVDLP